MEPGARPVYDGRPPASPGGRHARNGQNVRIARHRDFIAPPVRYESQRRSEEHTSELQSLMRSSYAVFCLTKKIVTRNITDANTRGWGTMDDELNKVRLMPATKHA